MNLEEQAKWHLLQIVSDYRGPENRIRRSVLLAKMNICLGWDRRSNKIIGDRKMRDLLEELRSEERGTYLCGSLRGGYFMARDDKELDRFTQPDLNRSIALYRRVKTQRTNAKLITPELERKQMEMF